MKIACIGWGSLIWQPKNLQIQRKWFCDGPIVPVEFARQSNDGRLTLVISENAKPIRTLWALMTSLTLDDAKESLRKREGVLSKNIDTSIASISISEETDDNIKLSIQGWLSKSNLDAAIWTNLPPKFNGNNGDFPKIKDAVDYLKTLDVHQRNLAEEYIRNTPKQIDTEYRRKFEIEFGWTFNENI